MTAVPELESPPLAAQIDRVRNAVIRRIEDGTQLRAKARKVLTGDEQRRIRDAIKEELAKPVHVMLKDKLSFTLGVIHMMASEHILLSTWGWFCFIQHDLNQTATLVKSLVAAIRG